MQKILALFVIGVLLWAQTLTATTATTTLQLIWPDDMLGMDQEQAVGKAVTFLQTSDFASKVGQMPNEWRERYSNTVGINNFHDTNAINESIQQNVTVNSDPERAGVITIAFSNSDSDVALYMAKRCGEAAVQESQYHIAEKTDANVANIAAQMEQIEDNIQQLAAQKRLIQQQASTPGQRGASIGAPMGMGPAVNPEGVQQRAQMSTLNAQTAAYNKQYQELNQQLQEAVKQAWKGKPKAGLVVVDQADLDE